MAVVAGTLILTVALATPRAVEAATTFEAVAAADGIRIAMRFPNAPVTDTPVDGGGPTAQAVLNSSGVSRAFAAQPYPGEAVVTGPGTVAGFTGGQVNPPAYPFVVSSDHPTVPEQSNEQGPYSLKASSAERQSASEARVGADSGPLVSARASVELGDAGEATAAAISDVSSLAVADVRFGRVLSTASVRRAPDGTLTRSSDLQVTGFTVGGTSVAIGPAGLTLPAGTVPLPPADPVRKMLADAGITITYLAAQPHPTGVVAPGLAITAPVQTPDGGTATVTYTLGQSSAAVAGVPLPGDDVLDIPGPDDLRAGPESGPSGDAPSTGTAVPEGGTAASGTAAATASPSPTARTGRAGDATTAPADPAVLPASSAGTVPAAPGTDGTIGAAPVAITARGFESASIFLVLAGAGLMAFGLVSLFSALGVRSR